MASSSEEFFQSKKGSISDLMRYKTIGLVEQERRASNMGSSLVCDPGSSTPGLETIKSESSTFNEGAGMIDESTDLKTNFFRLDNIKYRAEAKLKDITGQGSKEREIVVSLLDGSKKNLICENGKYTTAMEICNKMAEITALKPESKAFFSLWVCEAALELSLKPCYEPFILLKHYPEISLKYTRRPIKMAQPPRVEYRRNPFVTKYIEKGITDPCAIKLLYDQCRTMVITSMYPIDDIDAAQLAGLDMQLLFGDYEDRFYDPEFLGTQALRELIPATLCPLQSEEVWRDLVAEAHKYHKGKNDILLLQKLYLQYCSQFDFYGCTFFYGRVCFEVNIKKKGVIASSLGDVMRLGVNSEGLFIIDHYKNKLKLQFDFYEINWQYSDPDKLLYIEFGDLNAHNSVLFVSAQGDILESMILRFMELRVERDGASSTTKQLSPPASSTTLNNDKPSRSPSNGSGSFDDSILIGSNTTDSLPQYTEKITKENPFHDSDEDADNVDFGSDESIV